MTNRKKKKTGVCQELGLGNSTIHMKTDPKLLVRLNRMDRE
jgi:hypothetical protein